MPENRRSPQPEDLEIRVGDDVVYTNGYGFKAKARVYSIRKYFIGISLRNMDCYYLDAEMNHLKKIRKH